MLRRALLAIVFCVGLGLAGAGLPAPVQAQNSNTDYKIHQNEVEAYYEAVQDCSTPSLECLVRNTTRFVAMEWVNDIAGKTGKFDENATAPTSMNPGRTGGLTQDIANLMSQMYAYPPANTGRYVADVMDNAGIASPAYAQGLGFASLDPILGLWKMFRNVAYFFFIAIIIVIGIMIMLRQKISAQASVTAQQALPSIIISLILVTFSYAIAGLLIDVMYVSMFLIAGLFSSVTDQGSQGLVSMNIFELGGMLYTNGAGFGGVGNNIDFVSSIVQNLGAGNVTSGIVGLLGGLTLSIVIAIAVLIGLVKLFFELLKSYASIIMSVVFAPLYLMMGAIPGKNAFSPWIKNLVGNLAAFPTVLLFIIMFVIFTGQIGISGNGGFMPPYLIGNGQGNLAGYVIGLAILLALPEIVKDIKKKMGAGDGGFGLMAAGAAVANAKAGWQGTRSTMGIGARDILSVPALPLSVMGMGPQTKLESALVGSRQYRKREQELAIQSGRDPKTGAYNYTARPYGGLVGSVKDRFGVQRESLSKLSRFLSSRRSTAGSTPPPPGTTPPSLSAAEADEITS